MNKYIQAIYEYAESKSSYTYEDPRTGEIFYYKRKGIYKKNGRVLVYRGVTKGGKEAGYPPNCNHGYKEKDGKCVPIDDAEAAEYQGRKVQLDKPFRTPDGPKKMSVYVKNEKGNVVKVNFGDPDMEIKRDNPARRKSFRARHNCDNPGPKWKARYWSCKNW